MKYWRVDAGPDEHQLDEISGLLSAGGVLLMPTDTIYGLHAVATNERAVRAIGSLKSREDTKPFLVLGSSLEQLQACGIRASEKTLSALGSIWPAPLTVILSLERPLAAARGLSTIGVRVPAVPWLRDLLSRTGPLASTSANESGEAPIVSPSALPGNVFARLDGVVDAGTLEGIASAIVDLTGEEPRLLRAGEPLFTQKMWKTLRKNL